MTRRQRQLGAIAVLMLVLPVLGDPAAADPKRDKQAEAARIQSQLEEEGRELSVTAERYNQAQLRANEVHRRLGRTEEEAAQADQRMRVVRGRLSQAAVVAYVHGGSNAVLSNLVRGNNDDYVIRRQYLRFTAADQRRVIGELRQARDDLAATRSRLATEQKAADAAAADAASARRSAAAAEAAQRAALGRVNGELAALVSAEQARREAAEAGPAPASAPRAAAKPGAKPTAKPAAPAGPPPPVGKGAAAAVEEAKRQIGKPYVYGGSGPDSFDCSGLTAWAWRAGGVRLSHSARAQYHETTRVSEADIQPGDLLFFGPSVSGIHHNAIYVGGGQMIEASQTGVPVRYRGWRSKDLVGIGRPG